MDTQSSTTTGAIGLSAASLVPLIQWGLNGFVKPVPQEIPLLLAVLLVAGGHFAVNMYRARIKSEPEEKPVLPVQSAPQPAIPTQEIQP